MDQAGAWSLIEDWLRDALSWAITPAADLRRRIGEGAASQPRPDEDDEAEVLLEPEKKTPRLDPGRGWHEEEDGDEVDGWPSPIRRTQAVSHLPSDDEEEEEERMQPTD